MQNIIPCEGNRVRFRDYAGWALLDSVDEHNKVDRYSVAAVEVKDEIVERYRAIDNHEREGGAATKVLVVTQDGHWGRGKCIADAAQQARQAGANPGTSVKVYLVVGDDTPSVDSAGRIERSAGSIIFPIGSSATLRPLMVPGSFSDF